MKSSTEIFSTLEYPDVPETECIDDISAFKQANPFDFTCTVEDDWAGEDTPVWKSQMIAYFNQASKGECVSIAEPELMGPKSIQVECKKNGLKVKKYYGNLACDE